MPVRRLVPLYEDLRAEELRLRLAREFRQPQEDDPEPIIIEEAGLTNSKRLYVIWSAWSDLDQRVRSKIIMDAYGDVHGVVGSVSVTVAMGLTPDEAGRMGLKYQ